MHKKTCYEMLGNGVIILPHQWVNGKRNYPYGKYAYEEKQLAQYRKDHINEPSLYLKIMEEANNDDMTYRWKGEPCKRCQIKEVCNNGFPNWLNKIKNIFK